jgi:DNA-binding winged helix-turn-helix (wHTH) protein
VEAVHYYEFGPYRLDVPHRLLLQNMAVMPLPAKAFDALLILVRSDGGLVEKAELMKAVWPDTFVEEGNLTQTIFLLRKTFGESASDHRYIVTVPGRGYRFAAPVKEVGGEDIPTAIESGWRHSPGRWRLAAAAAILIACAGRRASAPRPCQGA